MNDFIIAGVANSVQMVIGYPLDTAKIWAQSEQKKPFSLRNLYSGIKYPLIGQGAMTALCFSSYNYGIKQGVHPIISGVCSGSIVSLIIVPFEVMKISKQYSSNSCAHPTKHYFQCLIPVAMRETAFIATFLNLQRYFSRETDISPPVYGAICSSVSWIVTYPLDSYKTNQILHYSLGKTVAKRMNIFDIGLVYSLCRVSLGGTIFMTVYTWLQKQNY